MSHDIFISVCMFAFVSSITPGPNNTMILASGVNFGLRRSLGHLWGISLGFGFMLVVIGLGLHTVLQTYPVVLEVLRYAGAAYLLWLAYQLATASPPQASSPDSAVADRAAVAAARPMGFWAAVAFQWVNPKAWVMAMTAMTAYLPGNATTLQVLLLSGLFTLINLPCVGCWAAFGSAMRRFLQDPLHLRIFNVTMALGLVASIAPMLLH